MPASRATGIEAVVERQVVEMIDRPWRNSTTALNVGGPLHPSLKSPAVSWQQIPATLGRSSRVDSF